MEKSKGLSIKIEERGRGPEEPQQAPTPGGCCAVACCVVGCAICSNKSGK